MPTDVNASLGTFSAAGTTVYGKENWDAGMIPFEIHERVSLTGGASGSPKDLAQKLPPHTFLMAYSIKAVGAHTIGTATHISFGIDGDIDAFVETAHGNLNADNEWIYGRLTNAANTAEDTLRVTATNGSGVAAGTLTGTYDVSLYGFRFRQPAD